MKIWISITQEACLAPPVVWGFKYEGQMSIGACAKELRYEMYAVMEVHFDTVLNMLLNRSASDGAIG
jgi:hypothetical protein